MFNGYKLFNPSITETFSDRQEAIAQLPPAILRLFFSLPAAPPKHRQRITVSDQSVLYSGRSTDS